MGVLIRDISTNNLSPPGFLTCTLWNPLSA